MSVLKSLLLCSLAAVLLWGGWVRGGFSYASSGLLTYTSHVQPNFGSLCPSCSWSFDIICIYHSAFQSKTLDRLLKIVSWNVKGLNHPVKRRRVFSHIKQFKPAFIFLQETHIRGSNNPCLMSRWAGQHFHSSFQAKARGVSILVDQNIQFVHHNVISDTNGRFIIVSGKLYNTMMVLANVYAPNVDDVGFLERFFSSLPDLSLHSLILGGDFNCWLDPVLDRSSPNPDSISRSASFIHSFLSNFGISDVWCSLHPNKRVLLFLARSLSLH